MNLASLDLFAPQQNQKVEKKPENESDHNNCQGLSIQLRCGNHGILLFNKRRRQRNLPPAHGIKKQTLINIVKKDAGLAKGMIQDNISETPAPVDGKSHQRTTVPAPGR